MIASCIIYIFFLCKRKYSLSAVLINYQRFFLLVIIKYLNLYIRLNNPVLEFIKKPRHGFNDCYLSKSSGCFNILFSICAT